MSEKNMTETKRQSVWNGQEIPDEFWAQLEAPKRELPTEPARVLAFPKK